MTFNSTEYGIFFVAVFVLYWLLRGKPMPRYAMLLVASWFFYACWNYKYLILIWASSALDYYVGKTLGGLDHEDPRLRGRRRLLLLCSLVGNLGLLGLFKYYNFFRDNLRELLGVYLPQMHGLGWFEYVLPVGISFYTFQTLSYTIDVYLGKLPPAKSPWEFALFVAFFPQLVAGPIVRAADFMPQLDHAPRLKVEGLKNGLYRIMEGLLKKVVIADVLGAGLVKGAFDPASDATGLHVLLAIYGYALQIYGDFAGYSDIAIGSARLLGLRIPENFHAPYKAHSIQDFWRRWHISLSTWLRDYLYVPLGGNRKGPVRTYVNLAVVMLLGGLWHGAAWNFVAWGGMHGLWLGINRWWQRRGYRGLPGVWGRIISVILTFHIVCFAWVFFAARDFSNAWGILGRLFSGGEQGWLHVPALPMSIWFALAVGYLSHYLPVIVKERIRQLHCLLPPAVIGALWAVLFGLLAYVATEEQPFIYFQF